MNKYLDITKPRFREKIGGNARLTFEHFGQIEKGGKSCEHKIQNVFLK